MSVPTGMLLMLAMFFNTAQCKPLEDGYSDDLRRPLDYPLGAVHRDEIQGTNSRGQFGLRFRRLSLPRKLADRFYYDEHDTNWPWVEPRPSVQGTAIGMEWARSFKVSNVFLYAEFVDSDVDDGFWAPRDEDPLAGQYIRPTKGVGFAVVGINYGLALPLLGADATPARVQVDWVSTIGGGLGILTGFLDAWDRGPAGSPGYQRFEDGAPRDGDANLPRFLPVADLATGVRFRMGDRVSLRVEGGLHTLPFIGSALSIVY